MDGKSIIYQTFPRLWGDGTLASMDEASFEYFRSLGADCLWYTGIPRHATGKGFVKGNPGSPYAISDWYAVNPYLLSGSGSGAEEFRNLVQRTHAAGLKCITDFIPNHVACDYEGPLALYGWHDGDWTDTIKVDWTSPQTVAEMERVLRFWAGLGVDGFRCDMVELVPAEELGRVISAVKRDFPGLLFVAEVYQKDNYRRYLETAGFDLLYDKSGTYDILRGILAGERDARELSWNWQWLGDAQPRMLNFLENHDEQRIASPWFAGSADNAWAAVAYSALFNTASFMLYAGQEAGEDAAEGAEGRTSIFNWSKPRSLVQLRQLVLSGSGLDAAGTGILSRYRQILQLACSPAFRTGSTWDLCYCQDGRSFDASRMQAFVRYDGSLAWCVLCNFGPEPADLQLILPSDLRFSANIRPESVRLSAGPRDFAVVRIR